MYYNYSRGWGREVCRSELCKYTYLYFTAKLTVCTVFLNRWPFDGQAQIMYAELVLNQQTTVTISTFPATSSMVLIILSVIKFRSVMLEIFVQTSMNFQ
jgi:hypothetical protein